MQVSFRTNRLLLEPLALSDHDFIFRLVNTPGWIKFIGERNVKSQADAEAYIQRIMDNPNLTYWTVRANDTQLPLGIVTLIQRDYLQHPDIGYSFLPEFMGKGYAFEATETVLKDILVQPGCTQVAAVTLAENNSSVKLLKKLGLRFEETIEVENEFLDVYRVSADQFWINETTKVFFNLFTNANGAKPALHLLSGICIPEASIIRKANGMHEVFNLESFILPRQKILTDGTLKEFEEKELTSETKIGGNIAQRHSLYEKTGIMEGNTFNQKGRKLIHFIKTVTGWKISSVLWEDD